MANAAIGEYNQTPEPTNQNTDTQIYIPSQREYIPNDADLFLKNVPIDVKDKAQEYIEEQLKSVETIKIGAFLIGLLEKLAVIPSEFSAEDTAKRAQAVSTIEQLLLDIDDYTDTTNKFMGLKFLEEVVEPIGNEELDTYPIIQLLQTALAKARLSKQKLREEKLIDTQRAVMLGIAKQVHA